MLFSLFEILMVIINTLFAISILSIMKGNNDNIKNKEILKQMNTISTLISYKLNKLTSLKEEVNNEDNYEIKSFTLPKTIYGYTYTIQFVDKGISEEVIVKIEDLGLKTKSFVLKNGCDINYESKSNFRIDSKNIKFLKAVLHNSEGCKIDLYFY